MKRKILLPAVLFILGVYFIFAQAPSIKEVNGTVEIKRSASAEWTAAKAGDRIDKATVISTGFKSMAVIAVGNSTIVVRPLTRLTLEEIMLQSDTETVNVNLQTGRIQVAVNPPAGSKADFTAQSPNSTASVRGTSFEMDPENIKVTDGAVKYKAAGGGKFYVRVGAGQSAWVDTNSNRAVDPVQAGEQNRTLPVLAGQDIEVNTAGASPDLPRGTLGITVILGAE